MKSIEEKAKEAFVILGDKYFNLLKETNPRGDFKHFVKMAVEYGFRHGYKAANEWISVDDELPENMRTVIVRDNGISPIRSLALFQDNIYYPDFKVLTNENITHWRPIE